MTMPIAIDGEKEEEDKGTLPSLEAILPDELLQKVLSLLPIANIIQLSTVCKRWYEVVHSSPPMSWAMVEPEKPMFIRSCFNDWAFFGSVYDPCLLHWYNFDFPRLENSTCHAASSCGLVCLMNSNDGDRLLVGNPIKRDWKLLPQVPGGSAPHSIALSLLFDNRTRGYTAVVAKCTRTHNLPGKSHQWCLSVHMYQSTTKSWATPFVQELDLWMGGCKAVICDGVLYYFIRPYPARRFHLVAFDPAKPPSTIESLIQESIPEPYSVACADLINLSNKLIMVGWINREREGVVILELEDKTWREVAQMPISVYVTLPNNNFMCCGVGDYLFIHSIGWLAVLTFDMRHKVWKWSQGQAPCACTRYLQFRYQYYCGYCFEPRLDVSS